MVAVAEADADVNNVRVRTDKDGSFTFSFGETGSSEAEVLQGEGDEHASEGGRVASNGHAVGSSDHSSHVDGSRDDSSQLHAMHSELERINVGTETSQHSGRTTPLYGQKSSSRKVLVEAGVGAASNERTNETPSSMANIPIPVLSYRRDALGGQQPSHKAMHVAVKERIDPLQQYRRACRHGDLAAALDAVEEALHTNNTSALVSFRQKDFLRIAGSRNAVTEAFRFVQLLPRTIADERTYNMLITVCVQAADLDSALKAANALQSTGGQLDRTHYTNLIKAAAAAADADAAFKLYSEMRKENIKPCAMAVTTLIDACAREIIQRLGSGKDRRTQLVLTERAFQVFSDGVASGVKADLPMWNALLNVAGRSGKLDQAIGVMEKMQMSGQKPNDRTFSTLIAACKRAGQAEMALSVYQTAMRQGVTQSLMVYYSAVEACASTEGGPNLESALAVYADLKRSGVRPSTQFYSSLISIAGLCGELGVALRLQDDMAAQDLEQDDSSRAAVISACIHNNDLATAEQVYEDMISSRGRRMPHGFNTMINAYAQAFNIGNAVMVLEDMVDAGVMPDRHTYGCLIKACQRCGESDLAFLVYRLMRNQGFHLDEATAFTLIRASFNHIRSLWRPGGYPPTREGAQGVSGTNPAASALLKALNCPPQVISSWREKSDMTLDEWQKRGVNIYREFVSANHPFSMRMLDITLGCLRAPLLQQRSAVAHTSGLVGLMQLSHNTGMGHFGHNQRPSLFAPSESEREAGDGHHSGGSDAKKIKTIEIQFDSRAVSLVEEAISTGNLPQFSLDKEEKCLVNLCNMLPTVAEVYTFAMFRSLERKGTARFRHKEELTILVPPYNPTVLFVPSYEPPEQFHADKADVESSKDDFYEGQNFMPQVSSNPAVGLAVAAQLRRLKMYSLSAPEEGLITVRGKEITRWVRSRIRSTMNDNRRLLVDGMTGMQTHTRSFGSLSDQQRQIRVDLS